MPLRYHARLCQDSRNGCLPVQPTSRPAAHSSPTCRRTTCLGWLFVLSSPSYRRARVPSSIRNVILPSCPSAKFYSEGHLAIAVTPHPAKAGGQGKRGRDDERSSSEDEAPVPRHTGIFVAIRRACIVAKSIMSTIALSNCVQHRIVELCTTSHCLTPHRASGEGTADASTPPSSAGSACASATSSRASVVVVS